VDSTGDVVYEGTGAGAVTWNLLRVPAGARQVVTLADGTRAWLNASSGLRFPVSFGEGPREVELRGEGYFEVTADAARPFTVRVPGARVTATGTAFNVRAREEEGVVLATLASGRVVVVAAATGRRVTLSPGTRGWVGVTTGEVETRAVDVAVDVAWKDGLFYFKDETLGEIARELARWYGVEVVFEDERARHERYHGKIPRHERVEDVLRVIAMPGGARFVVEGRRVIVRAR
jgi:ferric-dicitrate binding protein FerR (iron transport regulator)